MGAIIGPIAIKEEDIETGGHYQALGVKMDIPGTVGWNHKDIVFPFPISLLSAEWTNIASFAGDEIKLTVSPDAQVGAITQDVSINDTVIHVNQTVIDNSWIGNPVRLKDGTNIDELGRIIDVDTNNLTVTVETAASFNFSASTPTGVYRDIEPLKIGYLTATGRVQLGESKIGGSHIPANTIIRSSYNNLDGLPKTFIFFLEYLY